MNLTDTEKYEILIVVKTVTEVFRVIIHAVLQLVTNVVKELITFIFTEENGILITTYKTRD
jgi:hypothetical protein